MAFLGRINSDGKLIEREVFKGQLKSQQLAQKYNAALETDSATLRTYIKHCDSDSCKSGVQSPNASTVRLVVNSVSASELNSMAETESSTLRYPSPISSSRSAPGTGTETETETLRYALRPTQGLDLDSPEISSVSSESALIEQCAELDKGSTISMCSWEPMYEEAKTIEETETDRGRHSYIVPPLELCSEAGSVSIGELKLGRPVTEAYENWLSAKQQLQHNKLQAARTARERMEAEAAYRRQLAEQRYRQWCERKAQQAAATSPKRCAMSGKVKQQDNELNKMSNMQAWELQKLKVAERRRVLLQLQAQQKQREQQQRQLKAQQAWQQWMKRAAQRPKPVPLNQGLKSLRGTVSAIYINPNPWVSTLQTEVAK